MYWDDPWYFITWDFRIKVPFLLIPIPCFWFSVVHRLFTSSRKWTATETGRSHMRKFWKIKRHSWTVKWQTMADSCMYHTMNYSYSFYACCRVLSFDSSWCDLVYFLRCTFTQVMGFNLWREMSTSDCDHCISSWNEPMNRKHLLQNAQSGVQDLTYTVTAKYELPKLCVLQRCCIIQHSRGCPALRVVTHQYYQSGARVSLHCSLL